MYAMTAERIEQLSRYANGVYSRDGSRYYCREGDFQDFKQTVLLYGMEYPEDSPALLIQRIKYARMCAKEAISYRLENIPPLSVFLDEDGELIENYFRREPSGNEEESDTGESWLAELGKKLFKSEKSNEEFQEYMRGGNSVTATRKRAIRAVLFTHRFEILEYLEEQGKLTSRERERLERLAKEMTKPAGVPKVRKQETTARACREYYQRNKAKFAARAKENYKKRKQARQAESEQSKGDKEHGNLFRELRGQSKDNGKPVLPLYAGGSAEGGEERETERTGI